MSTIEDIRLAGRRALGDIARCGETRIKKSHAADIYAMRLRGYYRSGRGAPLAKRAAAIFAVHGEASRMVLGALDHPEEMREGIDRHLAMAGVLDADAYEGMRTARAYSERHGHRARFELRRFKEDTPAAIYAAADKALARMGLPARMGG